LIHELFSNAKGACGCLVFEEAKSMISENMSTLRYVLRYFDVVRVPNLDNMNGVFGKVRKSFNTKEELLAYCKTKDIELGISLEWDDSYQNWSPSWTACGYDYVLIDIDKWFERHADEIDGEGLEE
jgi:hypothetical protein